VKVIAHEYVELQPHRLEANPKELTNIPPHVLNMLRWQFVTVEDLENCAADTLRKLESPFIIRGDLDTLTKYETILTMFGLLMSSRSPEVNSGESKYTYIYKGLFGYRCKDIYLDDIYFEVNDIVADGRLKYPREKEDGKQILVPYGWAQSVLDLMSQGVWRIEYDDKHHLYVAVFHEKLDGSTGLIIEPTKQFVGRKGQPCWKWELKGPIGQL